jgi:DNA-binding transcriptional LysR family regulator
MLPELSKHSEKLFYFYEVAQAGSLMACSRKLNLSAPTVSYAIKQLELVTHVKLFTRSKQGMRLTISGEHLFTFCKKYFQGLDDIQAIMKNPKDKPITRVRVGTFQSIAIYFWPLLLDRVHKLPEISLSIRTDRSHATIESLMKHEIDMALTVEGPQYKEIIRHELYSDEFCTYASANFKYQKLNTGQIKNMTLMYIPDAVDGEGISLKQHVYMTNLQFKEIFELDSFEVIAEFIKRGYGLGILPKKVAAGYGSALKEIRLEGTVKKYFGRHRFFLSYRNDLELTQSLMDLFLNSAREAVRDMSSET